MTALDLSPAPGAAPLLRAAGAQARAETRLTLRNPEQLLLTIAIPVVLLVLFAKAPVADVPKPAVGFVTPGILALAVMSTAFTGLAITTGFERRYAVLRRLGSTPLPRAGLLAAKTVAVLVVEALQVALLCAVALVMGWHPHGNPVAVAGLLVLGTAAFSSLGLLLGGTLRAETTLGAANLVYLVLLVLGGVGIPLHDFPDTVRRVLELLPISGLSDGLRAVLLHGGAVPARDWVVEAAWAAVGGAACARWFSWD